MTIKNISPGCYVCVEEDLRPGMHLHGGTGYVTDRIRRKKLITFTVTYDKFSSSGGFVEANITYRRLTALGCTIFSMWYLVQERSPPSNFAMDYLHLARSNPPVMTLTLYTILSMGYAKGRGWRENMLLYLKLVLGVFDSKLQ